MKDRPRRDRPEDLSPEESDALLEHAFERYFETSGLFGTPDDCLALVDQLKGIGVDEIACLIDFGSTPIPSCRTLTHLGQARVDGPARAPRDEDSVGADQRHGVTHMQCTPSHGDDADLPTRRIARARSLRHL